MRPRDRQRETQIVDFRRAGFGLAAIADVYGISRERVRQVLKRAGEPPVRPKWSASEIQRLLALYAAGASMAQCARELGRGEGGVSYQLHKQGVAVRPPVSQRLNS